MLKPGSHSDFHSACTMQVISNNIVDAGRLVSPHCTWADGVGGSAMLRDWPQTWCTWPSAREGCCLRGAC